MKFFNKVINIGEKIKINKLHIITIIILGICLAIYEVCFCNWEAIHANQYNFSVFRIVMYIIFAILYILFSKKFVQEAEKTLKSKKKILVVYIAITVLYSIYLIMKNTEIYRIFLIILAELLGILFILYVTKDYTKNIIITVLTFGFMFSITIDVFHYIDDKNHFLSAINVAVGNFNYLEEPLKDENYLEIEFNTKTVEFAKKYFSIKHEMNMIPIEDNEFIASTPATYNPLLYVPSALGINIARLLGGSVADVYIAGRMFNAIAFGALLIIVFKLLPFKKSVFYCMYLLPQAVAVAACYSIDGLTIGLIGIFIAYVLKLYKENTGTISIKQFIIMLALFMLSALSKSGAYIGICLIIGILPIIKSAKQNKKIIGIIVVLLIIAGIVGIYKFQDVSTRTEGDPRGNDASPARQIEYLLESPENIVKTYFNFMNKSICNLMYYTQFNREVFAGELYTGVTFVLFILVIYNAITDSTHTFSKKDKSIMYITFAITLFITSFMLYLLYTQVGRKTIDGYQARYLIPILPLILININSKKINKDYKEDGVYDKTAMLIGILMLADIISKILYI